MKIELDGSQGEGGGQILRSALTLSMITGTPFRIERIRARRERPGLLRQHLTAVNAAAKICGAKVAGNVLGSPTLEFAPGHIRGGDFHFAIGTAGSCTLVLQTILPALWFAERPSSVTVSGGTHNPAAPPADFLLRAWLPLLRKMGVDMDIELVRHGFYPAGGGELRATVRPTKALRPLVLAERGELNATHAIAVVAGLPTEIAQRELECLATQLGQIEQELRVLSSREGPGNVVMVELRHTHVTELFVAFGEKGVAAEAVATQVAKETRRYLADHACIGEYLADQLLLPMALAGSGGYTTTTLSPHLMTNREIIQQFLPVTVTFEVDKMHRVTICQHGRKGSASNEGNAP